MRVYQVEAELTLHRLERATAARRAAVLAFLGHGSHADGGNEPCASETRQPGRPGAGDARKKPRFHGRAACS